MLDALGRVTGRKKMQKIVHILQVANGPFEENFEYSFYGPYSDQLKVELNNLAESGLIVEEPVGETFEFRLTEKGRAIADEYKASRSGEWISFAKALNECLPRQLEALSTVLFICRSGYSGPSLRDKFNELKPFLAEHYEWSDMVSGLILNNETWEVLVEAVTKDSSAKSLSYFNLFTKPVLSS